MRKGYGVQESACVMLEWRSFGNFMHRPVPSPTISLPD
jgi:hypothetical protein